MEAIPFANSAISDTTVSRSRVVLRVCSCVLLFASLHGMYRVRVICSAIDSAVLPALQEHREGETRTLEIDAPATRGYGLPGYVARITRNGEVGLSHGVSPVVPLLPGDISAQYERMALLAFLAFAAEEIRRRAANGAWRFVAFLAVVPCSLVALAASFSILIL